MVWGVGRLDVAVNHEFGRPAAPMRGIRRVLVALTRFPRLMGGIGSIAVEIAAVEPAGRVKWSDILAWRLAWAS